VLGALQPDLLYLCLRTAPGNAVIEVAHCDGQAASNGQARPLQEILAPYLAAPLRDEPFSLSHPAGSDTLRVVVVGIGPDGADGLLLVGARQPGFPTALDRLVLGALVSQATVWLEAAQIIAQLLQSEDRFQLLVDSVQDYAIYLLDPQGVIVSWNTGAARIKGYTAEEIIGQPFARFYAPEDVRADLPAYGLAQARETGHFEAEGWRVRKDGSRFWANVVITPVYDAAGAHLGFAKVTRDLTERVRMEEQLRQLSAHVEQARENDRAALAREIHDELGGMLTGLKMDVAQLQRQMDPEKQPKLQTFARAIDEAIKTVRRMATDLRPAVLDDFGLLAAMEWQLQEFARRSGIRCDWQSSIEDLELPDQTATALFRAFQESLTNIARHAQATEVRVTCTLRDEQLELTVADNGVGITPQQLRGSRSLGLVGLRERVGMLGGTARIEGQPGVGTTVKVTIPFVSPAS
jgi:PAS domain S-box-containing protein